MFFLCWNIFILYFQSNRKSKRNENFNNRLGASSRLYFRNKIKYCVSIFRFESTISLIKISVKVNLLTANCVWIRIFLTLLFFSKVRDIFLGRSCNRKPYSLVKMRCTIILSRDVRNHDLNKIPEIYP